MLVKTIPDLERPLKFNTPYRIRKAFIQIGGSVLSQSGGNGLVIENAVLVKKPNHDIIIRNHDYTVILKNAPLPYPVNGIRYLRVLDIKFS